MKTTPAPVVVGIAEHQPTALRFAIRQARETRSPLWVVHSAGPPSQAAEFYVGLDVLQEIRATGQALLGQATELIELEAPDLEVETFLTDAAPIEALTRSCSDARMLVLGSDDVPWFERLLRTKIAGHLAQHLPCPVVVVPELEPPSVYDGDIVLALDGDTSADGPVRFAFEQAGARDAVLHVLHATPPGTLESDAEAIRANVSEILAGWCEKFPDVMVLRAFTIAEPLESVARATQSAGLVIVGRPHGRVLSLGVSRPLSLAVLRAACCPVAVVPATYGGTR